jgi:hypothetical protein
VANLSVGVLGILCYWMRDNFWVATVIGFSVWWLGDAMVHISVPWPFLQGHPKGMKMELPSLCRRRLCLVPQRKSPLHQCDAGASRHPELLPIEHEH